MLLFDGGLIVLFDNDLMVKEGKLVKMINLNNWLRKKHYFAHF